MNQTKVMACTCTHPYQDTYYKKGNRLFVQNKSGDYYCSVCEKKVATAISSKKK